MITTCTPYTFHVVLQVHVGLVHNRCVVFIICEINGCDDGHVIPVLVMIHIYYMFVGGEGQIEMCY